MKQQKKSPKGASDLAVASGNKIKSILISQPDPGEDSPYRFLQQKYGVKLDYKKFIEIEGVTVNEFRKQNVNLLEFDGIILTSKQAIDQYFRIVKEMKMEMPPDMKYYCVGEAIAKYLQKYIVIRKRKLFVGERSTLDLTKYIKKFSTEKFLLPASGNHAPELTEFMKANKVEYSRATIYNAVPANLSDLNVADYDLVCLFSPVGVDALVKSIPTFKQSGIKVGVFGSATAKAAIEAGLTLDIEAPKPGQPSMAGAIEEYIKTQSVA